MQKKSFSVFNKSADQHLSSLDKLRMRTITIFNILFVSIMVFVIIGRIQNNQTTVALINSVAVILILISILLSYKGLLNTSILVSCFVLTGLTFMLAYTKLLEPIHIIPQLTLLLATFIIILRTKHLRYLYITCCLFLLLLVCYKHEYQTLPSILFIIQIFGFSLAFNYFVNFLEYQDKSLNLAVSDLKISNDQQEVLNRHLFTKNEELKMFNHIMSHDLKSPLRTINSFSALIRKRIEFKEKSHEEYFEFIEQAAENMKNLIDELLLFHKVEQEEVKFEAVRIDEVFDTIISTYDYDLKQENLEFHTGVLPVIKGNKFLLKTLFSNLASNAVKYQPKNNKDHKPKIEIKSYQSSDAIEIYFADNGIGIKDEYLENLFKPFKRFHSNLEYKGTGLGMSICKRVIDKHNAKIEIHETSEKGTTFKLTFQKG